MKQTEQIYKSNDRSNLLLHIFRPENLQNDDPLPAIVFFFGGGWVNGSPEQFFRQCEYLASRGMVAVSAEYRVRDRQGVTPLACVADGKSAIRWVRAHAAELGIDETRIVASGSSAGGHVAACTSLIAGLDEPGEDLRISSRPNAMILFNPVLNLASLTCTGNGDEMLTEDQKKQVSPELHIRTGLPPTLIFHGTVDEAITFESVERFARIMQEAGNICTLVSFEGMGHGFFNYDRYAHKPYAETLRLADQFLCSLGYLNGTPII